MLIRDVSESVADPQFKRGLTKGWYKTRIRITLDELQFRLKFDGNITLDLDYPTATRMITVPDGLYDLQELYLWSGDQFTPSTATPVWWKRRLDNKPFGQSWTAQRTVLAPAYDPFNPNDYVIPASWIAGRPIFFANIENGIIQFDEGCDSFPKVRMVYLGSYGAIDEVKCIPRVFYTHIFNSLSRDFYAYLMGKEPRMGWQGIYDRYVEKITNNRDGSLWEAQKRAKEMDGWVRASVTIYADRGNW